MLVSELIHAIYEDNYSHLEFIEAMNGGECDCNTHRIIAEIEKYWNADLESEGL